MNNCYQSVPRPSRRAIKFSEQQISPKHHFLHLYESRTREPELVKRAQKHERKHCVAQLGYLLLFFDNKIITFARGRISSGIFFSECTFVGSLRHPHSEGAIFCPLSHFAKSLFRRPIINDVRTRHSTLDSLRFFLSSFKGS